MDEINLQVKTAKEYPRSIKKFMTTAEEIIDTVPGVAETCYYTLPKGKRMIEGASVRLAEIVVSCWGNLHAETKIVEGDGRSVLAEAFVWDVETNIRISQQCRRSTVDSYGKPYSESMQNTTAMAAQSIAFRNAVFKVLPRCMVDNLLARAKQVVCTGIQSQEGTVKQAKVDAVLEKLAGMGLGTSKLLKMLRVSKVEHITSEHYGQLIGIGTAIKEGIHIEHHEEKTYISTEEANLLKAQIIKDDLDENSICEALGIDSLFQLEEKNLADALELIPIKGENHGK